MSTQAVRVTRHYASGLSPVTFTLEVDRRLTSSEAELAACIMAGQMYEREGNPDFVESYTARAPRWVVLESNPGCLPETEPAIFDLYADAMDHIRTLRDELLEQSWYLASEHREANGTITWGFEPWESLADPPLPRLITIAPDYDVIEGENGD